MPGSGVFVLLLFSELRGVSATNAKLTLHLCRQLGHSWTLSTLVPGPSRVGAIALAFSRGCIAGASTFTLDAHTQEGTAFCGAGVRKLLVQLAPFPKPVAMVNGLGRRTCDFFRPEALRTEVQSSLGQEDPRHGFPVVSDWRSFWMLKDAGTAGNGASSARAFQATSWRCPTSPN